MELAAVAISVVAVATSALLGWRALIVARHSNNVPVLIELFGEHRDKRLADAREFVYHDLAGYDLSMGLRALPADEQVLIRELAWFYDNLGALVAHGIVDIEPVSGYLGGSVLGVWEEMKPLIEAERKRRSGSYDIDRWQIYFENLYHLVRMCPPGKARSVQRMWRLGR